MTLEELQRTLDPAKLADLEDPLVITLMSANPRHIRSALKKLRHAKASWAEVADLAADALSRIGGLWQQGSCYIFEEHAASEALRRALIEIIELYKPKVRAKLAILVTPQGEAHTLGLYLAELVLVEAGWSTLWVGEGPPVSELTILLDRVAPDLVVTAASQASAPKVVRTFEPKLIKAAQERQVAVVLGGRGPWKTAHLRVSSFVQLSQRLTSRELRQSTGLRRNAMSPEL